MARDPRPLLCRKCGADLKSVPRPFSRFAECPDCKCELHVCKMCRHYNPRYVGQCDHDFADKVLEKEKSNFCAHFKPDPGAHTGEPHPEKKQAQQQLGSLFGDNDNEERHADDEAAESEADAAKKRLDDLFKDM